MCYRVECVSPRVRPKREKQKNEKTLTKKTSKNRSRKRDATSMKTPSKSNQKSIKNESQKNDEFLEGGSWVAVQTAESPGSPKMNTNQQDNLQKNNKKQTTYSR